MKTYKIIRNKKYDFIGDTYSKLYPNIHKYPATMIPQIGIELFKDLNIKKGKLLDPYCGSGSSFVVGLDGKMDEMAGYDINPLAVLISKTKYTKINLNTLDEEKQNFRNSLFEFVKKERNIKNIALPNFNKIETWFSKEVLLNLSIVKHFIEQIENANIQRLFWVPYSETIRECSYTRINEFKLYRIKEEERRLFNPDVFNMFFDKLNKVMDKYRCFYYPKLNGIKIAIKNEQFMPTNNKYDVVLTSPPYGDSRTTVAYGQFSQFSNEWLGNKDARQLDNKLMGGASIKNIYDRGLISEYINRIMKEDEKRAFEVSSFYFDLDKSIQNVAKSVAKGGMSIYVVGNRRVKNIQLVTDQFIAEKFEENGFKHMFTYERLIGNKSMPLKNSPTNKTGKTLGTMTQEFIVVSEKIAS